MTTQPTLLCTVRQCRQPLICESGRFVCEAGHCFDTARSGYVNLLQPQDRRSRNPGDSARAVAARRRLHDQGISASLLRSITDIAAPLPEGHILDVGAGDGFYLAHLGRKAGIKGCGIDISIPAVDAAARRYPEFQWVVANADRFVPYADASFSILLSITGRMHPAEFRRVLCTEGRLLIALSAPDDLIELRGQGRDRVPRTLQEFEPHFRLIQQQRATTTTELDAAAVDDVRLSTYRPLQSRPAESSRVTFSLDLLLFTVRNP